MAWLGRKSDGGPGLEGKEQKNEFWVEILEDAGLVGGVQGSREKEFSGQARAVKELSGKFTGYLSFIFTITVLSFFPLAIWGSVCLFGYG